MKRALLWILVLAMLMTGLALAEGGEEPALQQDVVVLFTSDVHCGVEQGFGYVGLKAVKEIADYPIQVALYYPVFHVGRGHMVDNAVDNFCFSIFL